MRPFGRLAFVPESADAQRIEGAHHPRAGSNLAVVKTHAFFARLLADLTVARQHRVAGIHDDLAGEILGVVLGDLRHRAVRHRDQNHIAKRDRVFYSPGARLRPNVLYQRLQIFRIARRKQDLMPGLRPKVPSVLPILPEPMMPIFRGLVVLTAWPKTVVGIVPAIATTRTK